MEKFLETLKAGFVSHAYIFLGPDERVMKQAKLLARTVNCENVELSPCGFCDNCRKILNGIHPDVMEISAEGASIKIDQVRNLIQSFVEKPLEASRKVYIIHEAHKMTPEAQNALLKTLEEPASQSTAVLLTDNLKLLLSTVISRCQVLDFSSASRMNPLCVETRQKIAGMVLEMAKNPEIDPGSMARQIAEFGEEPEQVLDFLSSLYRDILAVKTKSRVSAINADLSDVIYRCATHITEKSAVKALGSVFYQARAVKSRGNQNLIWYNLLIELQEVV